MCNACVPRVSAFYDGSLSPTCIRQTTFKRGNKRARERKRQKNPAFSDVCVTHFNSIISFSNGQVGIKRIMKCENNVSGWHWLRYLLRGDRPLLNKVTWRRFRARVISRRTRKSQTGRSMRFYTINFTEDGDRSRNDAIRRSSMTMMMMPLRWPARLTRACVRFTRTWTNCLVKSRGQRRRGIVSIPRVLSNCGEERIAIIRPRARTHRLASVI